MMPIITSKLTVYFEDPFWVGLYERQDGRRYEAAKITFGAEPKDCEVHAFLLRGWDRLRFSPPVRAQGEQARRISPKRMQRRIRESLENAGPGTKAQQALKLQQEAGKLARRVRSREEKLAEKDRKFQLRQDKRREKHKGH